MGDFLFVSRPWRGLYSLDCFVSLAMTGGQEFHHLCHSGGRPQNLGIDVMRACARHNPLDCFVSLAMTSVIKFLEIRHHCHCEQAQRAWQSRKHTNKFKFLETSRGMRYTFLALGNRCRLRNLIVLSVMTQKISNPLVGGLRYI